MDILNQCKFELSSFVLIHMAFGQEKWDLLFCDKLFLRSNLYKFGEMHCKKLEMVFILDMLNGPFFPLTSFLRKESSDKTHILGTI